MLKMVYSELYVIHMSMFNISCTVWKFCDSRNVVMDEQVATPPCMVDSQNKNNCEQLDLMCE